MGDGKDEKNKGGEGSESKDKCEPGAGGMVRAPSEGSLYVTEDDDDDDDELAKKIALGPQCTLKEHIEKDVDYESLRRWKEQLLGAVDVNAVGVVRPRIERKKFRITRLPRYLILHMQRFTKNNFFVEKNPTLVNFPVKNLELRDYIPLPTPNENEKLRSKYDLIGNIVHDGKPGEGPYRVFVQRKSEELWYEMQDLHVSETLPQMVALSEAYMQIYEQQQ